MMFATYATFKEMHGIESSLDELVEKLRPYSQESVLYVCSLIGVLLRLWEHGHYDLDQYDHLISCFFEFLRGDWFKLAARRTEQELVFHRRQLLLIAKLAVQHCSQAGRELLETPPGMFGTILLMANDHFHYGLTAEDESDEVEKVERLLAEFVPVAEGTGFRLEHRIVRSHLMLKKYPDQLRDHPEFVDIGHEFESFSGVSLADHEALCFGLVSKYVGLNLGVLQKDASALALRAHNFSSTAIPAKTVGNFLEEMVTTPQSLTERIAKRDYGTNDFTELRKRPLVSTFYGYLPLDVLFIAEKFETGPYWAVNNISKSGGDRLRRFWGAVFEMYVNSLLRESL